MGINLVGPVGGAAAPASSGFMPTYPANQVIGEAGHIPNNPSKYIWTFSLKNLFICLLY
jgi:hypothetical protein